MGVLSFAAPCPAYGTLQPGKRSNMSRLQSLEEPRVRYAQNAEDLRVISQWEAAEYGAHSIDAAGLVGWWHCYPKGVHLVEIGGEIVGALGLWPLAARVYAALVTGQLEETQIGAQADDIEGGQTLHRSWYVGDLILHPEYRQGAPQVLLTLLSTAVTRWVQSGELAPIVDICAFGFTEHAQQFLAHFGFRREVQTTSPLGYPIYQRTAAREALQAECAGLANTLATFQAPS